MTLLESLITIIVISIILAFSISSFESLFQPAKNEMYSAQLMRVIHLARETASQERTLVTLCKSKDQRTCSGDWQDGYLLLKDNKILFSFNNHTSGILHWRAFPHYLDHLEFLPSGLTNFQNGTFWYCLKNAVNPEWAVMMSQSGRARLVLPDENGFIKDDKNKPMLCH